jgi:hypothetical protein
MPRTEPSFSPPTPAEVEKKSFMKEPLVREHYRMSQTFSRAVDDIPTAAAT